MKTYEFTIKGIGKGKNLQEAWRDYLDAARPEELDPEQIESVLIENDDPTPNGYVCFWNGIRKEVWSDSAYHAQQAAEKLYQKETRKKVRGYDISTTLCEKDGKPVIHTAVV